MNEFPNGPFFNFRTRNELNLFQRIMFVLLGPKRVASDGNYRVTAYHRNNVTYIRKIEIDSDIKERK